MPSSPITHPLSQGHQRLALPLHSVAAAQQQGAGTQRPCPHPLSSRATSASLYRCSSAALEKLAGKAVAMEYCGQGSKGSEWMEGQEAETALADGGGKAVAMECCGWGRR